MSRLSWRLRLSVVGHGLLNHRSCITLPELGLILVLRWLNWHLGWLVVCLGHSDRLALELVLVYVERLRIWVREDLLWSLLILRHGRSLVWLLYIIEIIQKWILNLDIILIILGIDRWVDELLLACADLVGWPSGRLEVHPLLLLWRWLTDQPWCSLLLQSLDAFYNFDSMESHLDIQIILQVLVSDEINHCSIECQIHEVLFVLREPERVLQPD